MSNLHLVLEHLDKVLVGKYDGRGFTVTGDGSNPSQLTVEDGGSRPTNGELTAAMNEVATNKPDWVADREIDKDKALKTLVIWIAGKLSITPQQAKTELIAIYKSL